MSNENLYYSVRVVRRLQCNCSAYKFPHTAATGDCLSLLPDDLDSIPCKVSYTAIKRAKDLISNGYL